MAGGAGTRLDTRWPLRLITDIRSERATRTAAAALLASAGAIYVAPNEGYWGLAMIAVQAVMSYFPTVSLGQALCPAACVAWGLVLGCGFTSALYLCATAGATALWVGTILTVLLLEPVITNKDPYVAGLTFAFVLVVVDGVLLEAVDSLVAGSLQDNVRLLSIEWAPGGEIRTRFLGAFLCLGLVIAIHLLPPWRSTSMLNSRLVSNHLSKAGATLEDIAAVFESSVSDGAMGGSALAQAIPLDRVQQLSQCCMQQMGALRSLPGFLTMVDYEPVLWPLSARHVGMPGWKELLSRIRVMLQRMYDLTIMLERRGHQLSLRSNILSVEDSREFALLATVVRESVAFVPQYVLGLEQLGGFLCLGSMPALERPVAGTAEAGWPHTAQQIQELLQQRQAQQLTLLCDSMLSGKDMALYRRAVLAAYSRTMYGGTDRESFSDSAEVPKEEVAKLSTSLLSFYTDALTACVVRLVAPTHLKLPMAEALLVVYQTSSARHGWAAVSHNLWCWWGRPLSLCCEAYLATPGVYRTPRAWWRSRGRHFIRVLVGVSFLHGLGFLWPTYRNFILPGSFAGWQGVAFIITLQGNAEATLKKGLLRMAGTLLGGVIGGLGAYAGLFSSPALVCIVVLVNMAVVWVTPTPPFTRFPVNSTDYEYAIQSTGITCNLILFVKLSGPADLTRVVLARVVSQVIGIGTAIAIACCCFPQSGYARARKLTGRALKLGGSLLPHLAKHYFGIYGADPKDVETRHARSYADLERLQLAMDREDSGLSFGPPPLSRQPSQPVSDGRESHLAPQPLPAPSPPGNNASCAATASSSARGAPQPQEIPSNTNGICCQTSTEMQPRGETCSARQNPTPLSPEVPDAEPGAQRSGSTSDDEGIRPLASFPSSSAAVGSNGDNASTLGISIENVVLSVENGEDIDAASIIAGTEAETNAAHTWAITDDWDISGLMGVQQDISPGALLDEVPLTDDNAPTGYCAGLPEVHRRLQVCMDLMDAANAQIKLAEKVVVRLVPSHSEMPHSGVALCVADVPVCTEWAVWLCLVEVHSLLGLRQPCAAGGAAR